jgi:predicted transposase YdaD
MFQLHDLRKTRVWQEALDEGQALLKRKLLKKYLAMGIPAERVAQLLEMHIDDVRRQAKNLPVHNGNRPKQNSKGSQP